MVNEAARSISCQHDKRNRFGIRINFDVVQARRSQRKTATEEAPSSKWMTRAGRPWQEAVKKSRNSETTTETSTATVTSNATATHPTNRLVLSSSFARPEVANRSSKLQKSLNSSDATKNVCCGQGGVLEVMAPTTSFHLVSVVQVIVPVSVFCNLRLHLCIIRSFQLIVSLNNADQYRPVFHSGSHCDINIS